MQLTKLGRFELSRQESVGRRAFFVERYFRVLLTSLASNGAVHVRGRVLKFTYVVDDDPTELDVHTYTIAFSPSVWIKCISVLIIRN